MVRAERSMILPQKELSYPDYHVTTKHCYNLIKQQVNIVGYFNLNRYMRSMSTLYRELEKIKKPEFQPNDRIIFELFDHDFFLDNDGPGWTLYNLQLILHQLDISNFFCLLLTNYPDYDQATKWVQTKLTHDACHIRSITTLLNRNFISKNIDRHEARIHDITKSYCVLSRQSRPHRTFFVSKLMHENLLDHGVVGFNNLPADVIESKNNFQLEPDALNFSLLEIPKFGQKVMLKNPTNRKIFEQFQNQFSNFKNFEEHIDLSDKEQSCSLNSVTPLSRAFLYVALESEVEIPKIFYTRITMRGIIERRPFVVLACPGLLKFLRSRGFRTFDSFWDESYDDKLDLEDRVEHLIGIIRDLSQLNVNELHELYAKMQPIIDHNYNFFHNELVVREQNLLEQALFDNLSGCS